MKKGCIKSNPSKVPGKLNTGHIRANPNSPGTGKVGKNMSAGKGRK